MPSPTDDPWGPKSEVVTSERAYFDADERREVSTFASPPSDEYDGYGFRLWTGQVAVPAHNTGGEGRVEVTLTRDSQVIADAELQLDADETSSATFDIRDPTIEIDQLEAEARPAE